ncbi:MAG: PKD domain-containing protein [Candidatus Hodarchaeota archaeon]
MNNHTRDIKIRNKPSRSRFMTCRYHNKRVVLATFALILVACTVIGSKNEFGDKLAENEMDNPWREPLTSTGNVSTVDWNRTFGGPGDEAFKATGSDGTYVYTCGSTSSYGNGGKDVLLVKWDMDGNVVWYRTWGGALVDEARGIWVNGSNIYTCGITDYQGYDISGKSLLIKWDSAGNVIWTRTWGNGTYSSADAITGYNSSIYVGGTNFVTQYCYWIPGLDLATELTKIDPDGTIIASGNWCVDNSIGDYEYHNYSIASICVRDGQVYTFGLCYGVEDFYQTVYFATGMLWTWDDNCTFINWRVLHEESNTNYDDFEPLIPHDMIVLDNFMYFVFTSDIDLFFKCDTPDTEYSKILIFFDGSWNKVLEKDYDNVTFTSISELNGSLYASGSIPGMDSRDTILCKLALDGTVLSNSTWEGEGNETCHAHVATGSSLFTCGSTNLSGTSTTDSLLLKWSGLEFLPQPVDVDPIASFFTSVTEIPAGNWIKFYFSGNQGNGPAMFQWNFGDSTSNSTRRDPSHFYSTPGNYTVTLTVIDFDGDADTIIQPGLIHATDIQPVASFQANPTTIVEGEKVYFTFNGTTGNYKDYYQWDFGDGTPNSTSPGPSHLYSTPGNYTVTLTITDFDGDSDTIVQPGLIHVIESIIQPVASFQANATTIVEGGQVQFTFNGNEGTVPAMFQWDFGDGTNNSTEMNPVHQYDEEGNFTVTLTVIDYDGDADTIVQPGLIHVTESVIQPVASFQANATTIVEGGQVQFTFNGNEGTLPATFQWDFGDGTNNSTEMNPVHQYDEEGNFTVTLTVIDFDGDADTIAQSGLIHVTELDIQPVASFQANTTTIVEGGEVQFTFNGNEGTMPAMFQWDFGDGTNNSTEMNPVHQYDEEGNFTVTLTVIDYDGDAHTFQQDNYIIVQSVPPDESTEPGANEERNDKVNYGVGVGNEKVLVNFFLLVVGLIMVLVSRITYKRLVNKRLGSRDIDGNSLDIFSRIDKSTKTPPIQDKPEVKKFEENQRESEHSCMVCHKHIRFDDENVVSCPHCDSKGHYLCMLYWWVDNSICPVCLESLVKSEINPQPKDGRERFPSANWDLFASRC